MRNSVSKSESGGTSRPSIYLTHNQGVLGSSPSGTTKKERHQPFLFHFIVEILKSKSVLYPLSFVLYPLSFVPDFRLISLDSWFLAPDSIVPYLQIVPLG